MSLYADLQDLKRIEKEIYRKLLKELFNIDLK